MVHRSHLRSPNDISRFPRRPPRPEAAVGDTSDVLEAELGQGSREDRRPLRPVHLDERPRRHVAVLAMVEVEGLEHGRYDLIRTDGGFSIERRHPALNRRDARPASTALRIAMIWCSLYLLFRIQASSRHTR